MLILSHPLFLDHHSSSGARGYALPLSCQIYLQDARHCLDLMLLCLQWLKKVFCCIEATVFNWPLCLTITPRCRNSCMLHVPVFSGVVLCGVKLRTLKFCYQSLKASIDDERSWELFVVILEDQLVLAFPRSTLACVPLV